jgi:hypothetical protein
VAKSLAKDYNSQGTRRLGQGSDSREPSTCNLPCHESYFRWSPSMFVFYLRSLQKHALIFPPRPGLRLSESKFNLRCQCHKVRPDHQHVSEASQGVRSPLYPCHSLLTESHFSIVSRMLSNLPSQIRQEIEFIRPIVEERFAKMEEYGEDWDDKPVCGTIVSECVISLITRTTHRTIC